MAVDFSTPDSERHITLDVEGAAEENLARGVAAARRVFEEAGVEPWDGAKVNNRRNGDAG